ncbi:MAG: hypothetical protein KF838_09160 [Phycisphaeraceae bacterium]|nr:MAG: hypothetical protein KF838_09160 [Phycisphaeraceae bacterium]
MGWLDRLKKAIGGGGGVVGTWPSDQFSTVRDLVHAALSRFESSRASNGGWVSIWIHNAKGKELGVIQYAGDGIINLCSRDDIDLAALLRSAGREDLASRCDERDSAMFALQNPTREEVALAIDLVISLAYAENEGGRVMVEIDPG